MTILDIFSGMTRRANLMEAMIRKLGLSSEMRRLPGHRAVLERAAKRCQDCDRPCACQEWLATTDCPRSAPDYCRNHDLFERVVAGMETERTSASSPS